MNDPINNFAFKRLFKYYDTDRDDKLSIEDLKSLITEAFGVRLSSTTLLYLMKQFGNFESPQYLDFYQYETLYFYLSGIKSEFDNLATQPLGHLNLPAFSLILDSHGIGVLPEHQRALFDKYHDRDYPGYIKFRWFLRIFLSLKRCIAEAYGESRPYYNQDPPETLVIKVESLFGIINFAITIPIGRETVDDKLLNRVSIT